MVTAPLTLYHTPLVLTFHHTPATWFTFLFLKWVPRAGFTTSQSHPWVVRGSAFYISPIAGGCQEHHPVLRVYECPGLLTKGKLQWHLAQLWGPGECHVFGSPWVIRRHLSIKGPFYSVVMALLMWLLSQEMTWGSLMVYENWLGLLVQERDGPPYPCYCPGQDMLGFFRGSLLIQLSSSTQCPGEGAVDLFSSLSFLQLGLKFSILSLWGLTCYFFFFH